MLSYNEKACNDDRLVHEAHMHRSCAAILVFRILVIAITLVIMIETLASTPIVNPTWSQSVEGMTERQK